MFFDSINAFVKKLLIQGEKFQLFIILIYYVLLSGCGLLTVHAAALFTAASRSQWGRRRRGRDRDDVEELCARQYQVGRAESAEAWTPGAGTPCTAGIAVSGPFQRPVAVSSVPAPVPCSGGEGRSRAHVLSVALRRAYRPGRQRGRWLERGRRHVGHGRGVADGGSMDLVKHV